MFTMLTKILNFDFTFGLKDWLNAPPTLPDSGPPERAARAAAATGSVEPSGSFVGDFVGLLGDPVFVRGVLDAQDDRDRRNAFGDAMMGVATPYSVLEPTWHYKLHE